MELRTRLFSEIIATYQSQDYRQSELLCHAHSGILPNPTSEHLDQPGSTTYIQGTGTSWMVLIRHIKLALVNILPQLWSLRSCIPKKTGDNEERKANVFLLFQQLDYGYSSVSIQSSGAHPETTPGVRWSAPYQCWYTFSPLLKSQEETLSQPAERNRKEVHN